MDIKTVCTGLLTFGEASGYEIKKLFEDGTFNGVFDASFGSIYPALTRLAQEGLVLCRAEEQDGRPDKKVYSITPAGRAHFIAGLSRGIQPEKTRSEFLIAMIFAHLLPTGVALGYVEQTLGEYREAERRLEAARADPAAAAMPNLQFAIGLGLAKIRAAIDYMENNKALVVQAGQSPSGSEACVSPM
ncbi:PadR family transcriptional regulator [Zavarzinia compransoris]|uniref:PadR family transcriptional regulator n=1 Tax=Zavarzinia compransoris TaxID=1264899 RepID=A0A317DYA0_9PROT|nr:PadR family transcriptional regulator [Zavarzinia compransoris]PWR19717.1 PadR family transcriptional regulator [Zavarzinia compransoris]TDP43336.1 DNA-binding PadR family transcriptional regulator [Zavarzinia compransoris]